MRMRKKPNLIPRMEKCAHLSVADPAELRGQWLSEFKEFDSLYLEIGCGKGRFTVETAKAEPHAFLVGLERVADALVIAMERANADGLLNARFLARDAKTLPEIFAPGEVSRIYLNFSDPWPDRKHAKRRLTSETFLPIYREILSPDGEIHFKTDNLPLFEYSLKQLEAGGFELFDVTRNLHAEGPRGVMTDYELKFFEQGVSINRCVAKRIFKNSGEAVNG